MTFRCIRCHRALKKEGVDGLGPVCFSKVGAKPIPAHERDLFGFIPALAAEAATARLKVLVNVLAAQARIDTRDAFAAARRRVGVWAA